MNYNHSIDMPFETTVNGIVIEATVAIEYNVIDEPTSFDDPGHFEVTDWNVVEFEGLNLKGLSVDTLKALRATVEDTFDERICEFIAANHVANDYTHDYDYD